MHESNRVLVVQALVHSQHSDDGDGLVGTCFGGGEALVDEPVCGGDVVQCCRGDVAGAAEVCDEGGGDGEEAVEVLGGGLVVDERGIRQVSEKLGEVEDGLAYMLHLRARM
jgi:hypothetical protein